MGTPGLHGRPRYGESFTGASSMHCLSVRLYENPEGQSVRTTGAGSGAVGAEMGSEIGAGVGATTGVEGCVGFTRSMAGLGVTGVDLTGVTTG